MGTTPGRLAGAVAVVALAIAVAIPAAAEVYRTPPVAGVTIARIATGGESAPSDGSDDAEVALNTSGGTARGDYAAISNGGDGSSWSGASGSNGADSTGVVAVSHQGTATGHAAALGLVQGVAVSDTGEARYGDVNISGLGAAHGGAASMSLGGQASGGTVNATAWGDASGGTASIDPDGTVGTLNKTAWSAAAVTGVIHHTGLNFVESALQSVVIATAKPTDPLAVAQKAQDLALTAPGVAYHVATGVLGIPPGEGPQTDGPPLIDGMPWWMSVPEVDGNVAYQAHPDGCVPWATYAAYGHRGMPGQEALYAEMGTAKAGGTTLPTAHAVIKNHYQGAYQPILDRAKDAADLLNKATTATYTEHQGALIGGNTAALPWWTRDGKPVAASHVLAVRGYWHYYMGGGILTGDSGTGRDTNGTGYWLPIDRAMAFVNAVPEKQSNMIW